MFQLVLFLIWFLLALFLNVKRFSRAKRSKSGHIIVTGRRFNRKGKRINENNFKQGSITDENYGPYWAAYRTWIYKRYYDKTPLTISARLVLSPGFREGLYRIELTIHDNNTIPSWFPTFHNAPANTRDILHMSICFVRDIQLMKAADRQWANQCITDLQQDPNWSGHIVHNTYISKCNRNGTFHLAGFDSDSKMKWLHSKGHYKERSFGHIALYVGGLHR